MGFPAGYSGWTNRPGFKGFGVPKVPRVHALLNLGWARRLAQASEEQKERKEQAEPLDIKDLAKGYFLDTSQQAERNPFGHLTSLTQVSSNYSYEGDRVLTGVDHLSILGFPSALRRSPGVSERNFKSLSGEAFSLPSCATAMFAYVLNPWPAWWPQS